MTRKLCSDAVLSAFVAFVACTSVQGEDHTVEVVPKSNTGFRYNHTKGKGVNGFVYVSNGHTVRWLCPDAHCTAIKITFPGGSPCKSNLHLSTPLEGPYVDCEIDKSQRALTCKQSSKDYDCYKYTASAKMNGTYVDIPDDPELIVDDMGIFRGPLLLAGLALLLGLGAGYGLGRRWRA